MSEKIKNKSNNLTPGKSRNFGKALVYKAFGGEIDQIPKASLRSNIDGYFGPDQKNRVALSNGDKTSVLLTKPLEELDDGTKVHAVLRLGGGSTIEKGVAHETNTVAVVEDSEGKFSLMSSFSMTPEEAQHANEEGHAILLKSIPFGLDQSGDFGRNDVGSNALYFGMTPDVSRQHLQYAFSEIGTTPQLEIMDTSTNGTEVVSNTQTIKP